MKPIKGIFSAVQGTIRYKLLVLVLFPVLLIMPIALLLAVYWGADFSYGQLFIKVNTDLSVSDDIFRRIREDYLNRLGRLADSHALNTALEAGSGNAVNAQLDALRDAAGFAYLHLLDKQRNRMFTEGEAGIVRGRSSPSLLAAVQGRPRVGIEIFSAEELGHLPDELLQRVRMPLIATPRTKPTQRGIEDRGMMIRALYPVKTSRGEVVAVLDGGVLLNENFGFVDTVRDLVYGEGSLPQGSICTVTVFLEDVRITTNLPLEPGERALGTRASNEVRTQVLERGENWVDRDFVVNDWYISSYEPIMDVNGRRVGMLHAGFLEAPSRNALWQALAVLLFLFLALMSLSALLAVLGAKSIFKPLEVMSSVVRATRAGKDERIGRVASRDEVGELAGEFDAMLDLLRERKQQIQDWAGQLEDKVESRTAELQHRNDELQHTIRALRETREQLIVAEKLAALGELTAGVAHEINNPTAVMLGNLDVLVDELGEAADPVRQEIDLVIEQIYRIKDIIDDLLHFARPDHYAADVFQVDVNEVVQQTLALVRHLRKKSHFEIELDLTARQQVQINPKELQQVLVNLVVNAIHALGQKEGVVRIATRDWGDEGVMISVRDNGQGMTQEQLGRIFNPFYSTKRQGNGTGLGLSVSYSMVRRYGGNITVESEPGRGSEFSVRLLTESNPIEDEKIITDQLHAFDNGP